MDRLRIIVGYTVTLVWAVLFLAAAFGLAQDAPIAEATPVMLLVAGYLFWKGGNGAARETS